MLSSLKSLLPASRQDLLSLADVMQKHIQQERVSFHTPGHKGFSWQADGTFVRDVRLEEDLTELPGLDELAYPDGVIADLEKRAAKIWGAESTLISVNGATAGIIAAIIMLAKRGTHLLVPRNCHRSVIHGLVLSGLQPIWFEPEWNAEWGVWEEVSVSSLESVIMGGLAPAPTADKTMKIAGMVITNPTYSGALSDIESISSLARKLEIPLLVDEWNGNNKYAALACGADIVVNSLHKTLSCPTQTGLVHLTEHAVQQYGFSASELRDCLSLVQSSSPSYLFMSAIDRLVTALEKGKAQEELLRVEKLGQQLRKSLQSRKEISLYEPGTEILATDILIKHKHFSAPELQEILMAGGIFTEAILGRGLLLFLGMGSQSGDVDVLLSELDQIRIEKPEEAIDQPAIAKPDAIEQVLSPREAFYMPSQMVHIGEAVGQISAECLAPCPPGWAVVVPGQRINSEIAQFKNIESIRIVKQT